MIDSRNRIKKTILEYGGVTLLPEDPLFFNNNNKLIVYHPNNKLNISAINQVIFLNEK